AVAENCQGAASDDWDKQALELWYANMTGDDSFRVDDVDHDDDAEELVEEIAELMEEIIEEKAERLGRDAMGQLASQVMLRVIDTRWMAHLQEMDYLKAGIGLRAVGQRDPLVEYKNEAYLAFERLTSRMYDDYLRTLLRLQLTERSEAPAASENDPSERKMTYSSPETALESTGVGAARRSAAVSAAEKTAPPKEAPAKPQTYQKDKSDPFANVGRNDPCPCGSGKKFKKCCGA
ncbi:MAG: SEC-C domain-containing protein, partial [Eggerthellaceae bacterium]|nr:SEC-C domain-containing protein [Eggerthellaceae bacterium]